MQIIYGLVGVVMGVSFDVLPQRKRHSFEILLTWLNIYNN